MNDFLSTLDPVQETSDRRILCTALDWIGKNLARFHPDEHYVGEPPYCQAFGELTILISLLSKQKKVPIDFLASLKSFVLSVASERIFYERSLRDDFASLPHLYIYSLIGTFADRNLLAAHDFAQLRKKVHRGLSLQESVVSKLLELKCMLDLSAIGNRYSSYTGLVSKTVIGRGKSLCPVTSTDMEVYRLTHIAFHCSGFGSHRLRGFSTSQTAFLERQVRLVLPIFLHNRNLDLTAELLLATFCIGRDPRLVYPVALNVVLSSQWDEGVIPGPYFATEDAEKLEGPLKDEYVFATCYHSTLVVCLLLSVLL